MCNFTISSDKNFHMSAFFIASGNRYHRLVTIFTSIAETNRCTYIQGVIQICYMNAYVMPPTIIIMLITDRYARTTTNFLHRNKCI